MSRMSPFSLLVLVFLLVQPSMSAAQHMNEPAAPCRKFNGTSDLVECLQKADKAADFALNSISAELSKRLTGDDFERLKTTEALWRQYRETNCAAERACTKAVLADRRRIWLVGKP